MADRPTIEQQLAEAIYDAWERWPNDGTRTDYCEVLAAAIVAAVNNGDIDPILPDIGAWLTSIPAAELVELRALKAKVDGCRPNRGMVLRPGGALYGNGWVYATGLLAWLRETTDD